MDRYQGTQATDYFTVEEMAEQDALEAAAFQQLLIERRQWEASRDAIAEYEAWFLQKTIREADAETLSEARHV